MKKTKKTAKPASDHATGVDAKATFRAEEAANVSVNTSSTSLEKPGFSKRILIVEDHENTRKSIQRVLEFHGHRVWSAASATQALEIASANALDLVVTDIGLPDQNGHDLMAELHRLYGLWGIALSGYDQEEDAERDHRVGFRNHLTKPVKFEQLIDLITEFSHLIT